MKNYCLIVIVLLFSLSLQAQDEDFNVEEEIGFLKEEIENLQNDINNAEDPEEKEDLEKEMTVLKRSLGMLEKNKTTLMSSEVQNSLLTGPYMFRVPEFNKSRVDKITLQINSEAQLESHLESVKNLVEMKLPDDTKSLGLQLSDLAKDFNPDSLSTGDLAIGIWIMGNPDLALYIQSGACEEDPSRNDLLNNYASMLTMMGGEEYALPILQHLDNLDPNNSIILNNMGMAWFGLGAIDKAEQYLNKSIACPGNHSQAKMAKALIEDHKGNKQAAVNLVKESLAEGYSEDKENHLREMGIDPDGSYIRGTEKLKDEYLGLQRFINLIPAYPESVFDLAKAEQEWSLFWEKISEIDEELIQNIEEYEIVHKRALEKFENGQMELTTQFSPLAKKYIAKNYKKLIQPTIEEIQLKPQLILNDYRSDFMQVETLRQKLAELLHEEDVPEEVQCKAISEFISYSNEVRSNYNNEVIRFWKRTINTMAQYHKYYLTPTPETYQYTIMNLEETFLSHLSGIDYEPWSVSSVSCNSTSPATPETGPLPFFEDVHCDKKSELYLPLVGIRIVTNCHYMESSFKPSSTWCPIDLELKLKDDLLTGKHVGGSVTIGGSKSILDQIMKFVGGSGGKVDAENAIEFGPGKIDVELSASTTIEWDSQGITDITATLEVGGELTTSLELEGMAPKEVVIGAGGTAQLSSSPSSQLKSFLQD